MVDARRQLSRSIEAHDVGNFRLQVLHPENPGVIAVVGVGDFDVVVQHAIRPPLHVGEPAGKLDLALDDGSDQVHCFVPTAGIRPHRP